MIPKAQSYIGCRLLRWEGNAIRLPVVNWVNLVVQLKLKLEGIIFYGLLSKKENNIRNHALSFRSSEKLTKLKSQQ